MFGSQLPHRYLAILILFHPFEKGSCRCAAEKWIISDQRIENWLCLRLTSTFAFLT